MLIIECDCKNEFQDEQYGHNMRLHSEKGVIHLDEKYVDALKENKITEDNLPDGQYRCTVCGKTKYVGGKK